MAFVSLQKALWTGHRELGGTGAGFNVWEKVESDNRSALLPRELS